MGSPQLSPQGIQLSQQQPRLRHRRHLIPLASPPPPRRPTQDRPTSQRSRALAKGIKSHADHEARGKNENFTLKLPRASYNITSSSLSSRELLRVCKRGGAQTQTKAKRAAKGEKVRAKSAAVKANEGDVTSSEESRQHGFFFPRLSLNAALALARTPLPLRGPATSQPDLSAANVDLHVRQPSPTRAPHLPAPPTYVATAD